MWPQHSRSRDPARCCVWFYCHCFAFMDSYSQSHHISSRAGGKLSSEDNFVSRAGAAGGLQTARANFAQSSAPWLEFQRKLRQCELGRHQSRRFPPLNSHTTTVPTPTKISRTGFGLVGRRGAATEPMNNSFCEHHGSPSQMTRNLR